MTNTPTPTANGRLTRRPLEIPGPPAREIAVKDAIAAVVAARKGKVDEARQVIDDFGLTIEVARLRERLTGLPPTDLRRLLLSTPGVPEALFLEAIKEHLKDEREEVVSDKSVEDLGDVIKKSFADLSDALAKALDAIAKSNSGGVETISEQESSVGAKMPTPGTGTRQRGSRREQ
jgi:hypothetical protein